MATTTVRPERGAVRAVPLLRAYWFMPLLTGAAVIVTAAFMLVEVLVLESRIQDNVTPIVNSVQSIKTHTDDIRILNEVDATAKDIQSAAAPLTGQAATILDTVGVIHGTVGSIDAATGSINGHAGDIQSTTTSIAPHVRIIAENAEAIKVGLTTATGRIATALGVVGAATADTGYLAGNILNKILANAQAINGKLP